MIKLIERCWVNFVRFSVVNSKKLLLIWNGCWMLWWFINLLVKGDSIVEYKFFVNNIKFDINVFLFKVSCVKLGSRKVSLIWMNWMKK